MKFPECPWFGTRVMTHTHIKGHATWHPIKNKETKTTRERVNRKAIQGMSQLSPVLSQEHVCFRTENTERKMGKNRPVL